MTIGTDIRGHTRADGLIWLEGTVQGISGGKPSSLDLQSQHRIDLRPANRGSNTCERSKTADVPRITQFQRHTDARLEAMNIIGYCASKASRVISVS